MKNSGSGPKYDVSPMPVDFRYASALRGDRARILRVRLLGDRVDDVAGERQRRAWQERIHDRRVRIGDEDHVGGVDRLPAADRAAVEEVAVLERADFELADRHRGVLPDAEQVDELEVDHLRAVSSLRASGPQLESWTFPYCVVVLWLLLRTLCCWRARARLRLFRRSGCGWLPRPGVTKIFPSPMRPVRATAVMASTTSRTMSSLTMISMRTFGTKSTTYAEPAIDLFLATGAPEAFDLVDGHTLNANFAQPIFHIVQLERLDDGFDLFHGR